MTVEAALPADEHYGVDTAIDPRVDPEGARAAVASVQAPAEKIPLPPPPPDNVHVLPGGYIAKDGSLRTKVTVRELNGEDEEELARPANQVNIVNLIDTIVKRCVVDLDGVTPTPAELDTLLTGDREDIVRKVRMMTYGEVERLSLECPRCRTSFEVDYNVAAEPEGDVPVKILDGDKNTHERYVSLTKGGEAVVRLIDGAMQKVVYGVAEEKNSAELSTLMLRESMVSLRGTPITDIGQVRSMSASDRRDLRRYLAEHDCGPQWGEVSQECPGCANKFPVRLDLASLFQ